MAGHKLRRELGRRGKAAVNGLLGRLGLRLTAVNNVVLDLRNTTTDPIEGAYRAGQRPYLMLLPLADCRVIPASAYPCVPGVGNPFLETLLERARGKCPSYIGSPLQRFHQGWQPANAAEVLGLNEGAPSVLVDSPPLGFVMPWGSLSPAESLARWTAIVEADNREHGAPAVAAGGWKAWGPVDETVAELEFRRLVSVYESIKSRGYRRTNEVNGDIEGFVLNRDGANRVLVTTGHHRAAALAALGQSAVPLRLTEGIIRRSEVEAWPNVRAGLFTPAQAVAVFDRIFEGRQPR